MNLNYSLQEQWSFSHVGSPVVLQMGHRFFCISHCLMQFVWKSCPQSSIPRLSPSVYSSCRKKAWSKIDKVNKQVVRWVYMLSKVEEIYAFLFSNTYLANTARLLVRWSLYFKGCVPFPFHYLHNGFLIQSSAHISYAFFKCQQLLIFQPLCKPTAFNEK